MIRFLLGWLVLSFALTALWVGAITVLAPLADRWNKPVDPPDPEAEALEALERLWLL